MKNEKIVKQAIAMGKDYLEKNDLSGFYSELTGYLAQLGGNVEHIPMVTKFFEDNGVDTISMLEKDIPGFFCSEMLVPAKYVTNVGPVTNVLTFPRNIKDIKSYAFIGAEGFSAVDLRGIDWVGQSAFLYIKIKDILIDPLVDLHPGSAIFTPQYVENIWIKDTIDKYSWDMWKEGFGGPLDTLKFDCNIMSIKLNTMVCKLSQIYKV